MEHVALGERRETHIKFVRNWPGNTPYGKHETRQEEVLKQI